MEPFLHSFQFIFPLFFVSEFTGLTDRNRCRVRRRCALSEGRGVEPLKLSPFMRSTHANDISLKSSLNGKERIYISQHTYMYTYISIVPIYYCSGLTLHCHSVTDTRQKSPAVTVMSSFWCERFVSLSDFLWFFPPADYSSYLFVPLSISHQSEMYCCCCCLSCTQNTFDTVKKSFGINFPHHEAAQFLLKWSRRETEVMMETESRGGQNEWEMIFPRLVLMWINIERVDAEIKVKSMSDLPLTCFLPLSLTLQSSTLETYCSFPPTQINRKCQWFFI